MVKILEHIEGVRQAKGLSRKELAERMGEQYDKDKLDDLFDSNSCPRAETIAELLEALGLPSYPPEWFRSKRNGDEE